jgi:hypothetical protein
MSIVLVDRAGSLAQAQEAVLRLNFNRSNREFFYQAAGIPLGRWPAYRDNEIERLLNSLEWFDFWNASDGEYTIRGGMGRIVARKRGDSAALVHISARGNVYKEESWRRGEPCPGAWTVQMIEEQWDRFVDAGRFRCIDEACPEDCVATWDVDVRKAARACRSLAADGKWREALEVARLYPLWLPFRYLRSIVEGS